MEGFVPVPNHTGFLAKEVFGRAAELGKMGLTVPQVSRVFLDLAARGLDVDPRVYTVEAAAKQILAKAAGKGVGR